jgi:ABC-type polysaccharide/polyol phosphate transport system ATPase subunit
MNSDLMLQVVNVSKSFSVLDKQPHSLKNMLIRLTQGEWDILTSKTKRWVLKDVSFNVFRGEFVGIMGKNGAGKSTLFKLLCGIYQPTQGEIRSYGQIAPLIELGAGFHPDLTGFENIFLNSAILGFGRQQTKAICDNVIEFSELGDQIDMPIRTYSSGMLARLGFSVAVQLNSPILLIDEILAVGDAGFQKKCLAKIYDLYHEGRTIILITHDPGSIETYCTRCIVFDQMNKVFDGPPKEGAQVYRDLF